MDAEDFFTMDLALRRLAKEESHASNFTCQASGNRAGTSRLKQQQQIKTEASSSLLPSSCGSLTGEINKINHVI